MIVDAESFECPSCGKYWEEELMEACQEPFNGIYVECDCGGEFNIDICFNIQGQ